MRAILKNVVFLHVQPKDLVDFILYVLPKDDYHTLRIDLYAKCHQKLTMKNMRNHMRKKDSENLFYIRRWAAYCYFRNSDIVHLVSFDKKNILRIIGLLSSENIPEKVFKNKVFVWACDTGEVEVLEHILQLPGEEQLSNKGIDVACCSNQIEIVKILLQDTRINPAGQNKTQYVLKQSIVYGYTELVRLLLGHPEVYPSACHNEALHLALQYNRQQCVEMIKNHPKFMSDEQIERLKKRIKR